MNILFTMTNHPRAIRRIWRWIPSVSFSRKGGYIDFEWLNIYIELNTEW